MKYKAAYVMVAWAARSRTSFGAGRRFEPDSHFIGESPMSPGSFFTTIAAVALSFCFSPSVWAQGASAQQYQVTKITKNLITSPQFTYTGAEQFAADQRSRWLEVEVEFSSNAEFTDELTLRYFILVNGSVLTGEVTHTNVAGGRTSRSVMYVPPQALARVLGNRPMAANSIQNIAVQITQQGAVKDEQNMVRAAAQWYKGIPSLSGLVLNKNETPFAPLYWDRYEQIKPTR